MTIVLSARSPMNCGETMKHYQRNSPTCSRELASYVLNHVARYRITTTDALETLELPEPATHKQKNDALKHCTRMGWLGSDWLIRGKRYWYLTGSLEEFGIVAKRSGPLSEPAKLRAYAMLNFCCGLNSVRHKLTRIELAKHFPELDRSGLPDRYYLNTENKGRLGLVRYDFGHHGRWDRIVDATKQDIRSHLSEPETRRLISADRFEISILTVHPQKAQRLRTVFERHSASLRIPIGVYEFPQLVPLITSISETEVHSLRS